MNTAERVYDQLTAAGVSVLLDDRLEVTPGEKFADSDLIGIPTRLVISSRLLESGEVEIKARNSAESIKIPESNLIKQLTELHVIS
jgi:prolyl-tRNA synthetase